MYWVHDWARPLFEKVFWGRVGTVSGGMRVKFEVDLRSLGVLELVAFNVQKFMVSRDPDHALFSKTFLGPCPDFP